MYRKFLFPLSESDVSSLMQLRRTFCVVGVFSVFSANPSSASGCRKEDFVARVLGQHPTTSNMSREDSKKGSSYIELKINDQTGVAVLDVSSPISMKELLELVKNPSLLKSEEFTHCKMVLFLVLVCQFVVLVQNCASLSTRVLSLLRLLDAMRQTVTSSLLNFVSHKMRTTDMSPVPDVWMRLSGRFCIPRFIVCCLCSADFFLQFNSGNFEGDRGGDSKEKSANAFKKFCSAFEDETYHSLRKAWIVHEHGSINGMLAVPPKKPFIYVMQLKNTRNAMPFLLERLHGSARKVNEGQSHAVDGTEGLSQLWSDHIDWVLKSCRNETPVQQKHAFTDPIFDFPTLDIWVTAINVVHEFIFDHTNELKHFQEIKDAFDTMTKFSDHRCAKALPLSFRVYQDNLPGQYTSEKHQIHVQNAVTYFTNYARGPSYDRYLQQLKDKCQLYWENGHQVCEVKSLTNHHCVYPFHFLTAAEKEACRPPKTGTVKPHSSKLKSSSACNCGRKVGTREDPFTLQDANVTFYEELEVKCCNKYDHIYFPTKEEAFDTEFPSASVADEESGSLVGVRTDKVPVLDVRALEASLTQATQDSRDSPMLTVDELSINDLAQTSEVLDMNTTLKPFCPESESSKSSGSVKVKVPQPKKSKVTCEMLCSDCEAGFLPKVNMWSFVKFDEYSSYDFSNGLDLPGFIHGTNFLLPFDVSIVHAVDEAWPRLKSSSPLVDQTEKYSGVKQKIGTKGQALMGVSASSKTARAYIGFEYECFRGTRLFLSSRDSLVKGTPPGPDVALNAIKSNMPLYFPCSCRVSKNVHFAQMMRIHFVTPPNTSLTLNPVVRPQGYSESSVSFFPQWEPVSIPSSGHWVLRLPFIYSSSKGAIAPPKEIAMASVAYIEANIVSGASFQDT